MIPDKPQSWDDYIAHQKQATAEALVCLFSWLFAEMPVYHATSVSDLKISTSRIREETVYHGGPRYEGPNGHTVPLSYLPKTIAVKKFDNLKHNLQRKAWG